MANMLAEIPAGLPFAGLALGMPNCTMRLAMYVFRRADAALAVSSIRLALAAICKAHQLAGVWLDLSQPRFRMTLDGWRKCWPPSPPKLPLRHRNRSTLLPGFAAALRRSELMGLRIGDIARAHGRCLTVLVQRNKAEQDGRGLLGRVNKPDPLPDRGKFGKAEKAAGGLVVSGGNAPAVLEPVGEALNLILRRIQKTIDCVLN